MYEEQIEWLRTHAKSYEEMFGEGESSTMMRQAADAIEERDRYALTLQHEMMAEAESHIALVERLNKQVEELQKNVAYWQAQLTKSMCGETLAELERPRWVSVAERLPEDRSDVLAYLKYEVGGRIAAANYDKGMWQDCVMGGLYRTEEGVVTHWMPIPQPPKEET